MRQAYVLRFTDDSAHLLEIGGSSTKTGISIGLWDGSHWLGADINIPYLEWHHIAISRESDLARFFYDGELLEEALYTYSLGNNVSIQMGGSTVSGWVRYLNGYLQDLRLTKGVTRYTESFAPPTGPFVVPAFPDYRAGAQLSGNAIKATGGAADLVLIRDAATHGHIKTATPDGGGDWSADVPPGEYDITYFASGCQPISHGPYTVNPPA